MLLKLLALGGLGYAGYRYYEKNRVDKNGVAFVTDSYQKCIWKVVPGQPPESWVSGGSLQNPVGVTWSGQDLIVVDSRARDVFKISADGKTITSLTGKEASLDQK